MEFRYRGACLKPIENILMEGGQLLMASVMLYSCLSTTLPSANSLLSSALSWTSIIQGAMLPFRAKVSQKGVSAISCLEIPGCRTNCIRLWPRQVSS